MARYFHLAVNANGQFQVVGILSPKAVATLLNTYDSIRRERNAFVLINPEWKLLESRVRTECPPESLPPPQPLPPPAEPDTSLPSEWTSNVPQSTPTDTPPSTPIVPPSLPSTS